VQKIFSRDMWGMLAGNVDTSGIIDMTDKTAVWNLQAGIKGYISGDLYMNAEVDAWTKTITVYRILEKKARCRNRVVQGSMFQVPGFAKRI